MTQSFSLAYQVMAEINKWPLASQVSRHIWLVPQNPMHGAGSARHCTWGWYHILGAILLGLILDLCMRIRHGSDQTGKFTHKIYHFGLASEPFSLNVIQTWPCKYSSLMIELKSPILHQTHILVGFRVALNVWVRAWHFYRFLQIQCSFTQWDYSISL